MFDDSEECEHDEAEAPTARLWSWMRFGATVANFGANIAKSCWAFLDDQKDAFNAHVAVDDDTRDAWKSLHRDLESLPTAEK